MGGVLLEKKRSTIGAFFAAQSPGGSSAQGTSQQNNQSFRGVSRFHKSAQIVGSNQGENEGLSQDNSNNPGRW